MKFAIAAITLSAGLASSAIAGTAFYNGALTTSSNTFDNPGGSGTGSGIHFYDVVQFTVDVSGTYVMETASPNTNTANPSNALDTYLRIYTATFNPAVPAGGIGQDDFTGALTVLPGPYAGTVGLSGTGFTGAQPASRISTALIAGTTYFLVNTSFRETNYVTAADQGQPVGAYYTGISGQGNITIVPAPGALAMLGLGGLLVARRRR